MRSLVFALAATLSAAAFAAEPDEIAPPHVYQAVRQVAQDVELIREVMGRPRLEAPAWIVDHAEPRHVFYQAQTLFRQVGRLAQQMTGEESVLPPFPVGEIEPRHVLRVVQAAQERVERIRDELGISYRAELPVLEPNREPRGRLPRDRAGDPAVESHA